MVVVVAALLFVFFVIPNFENYNGVAEPVTFTIFGQLCKDDENTRRSFENKLIYEKRRWISFCNQKDSNIGYAVSSAFNAPHKLTFGLAGHLSEPGLDFTLENADSGERIASFKIAQRGNPGTEWRIFTWAIPESIWGKDVRIKAIDENSGAWGWFGFTEPFTVDDISKLHLSILGKLARILFICTVIFAVIGLSAVAVSSFKAGLPLLPSFSVSVLWCCLLAMLVWGISLSNPDIAEATSKRILSFSAVILLAGVIFFKEFRSKVPSLLGLYGIWYLATLFCLSIGFLYAVLDYPLLIPIHRFNHDLATDNILPYWFAEGYVAGVIKHLGDWLSSDRPPLQAAFTVMYWPAFSKETELGYQVLSTFLQNLVVPATLLFLLSIKIDRWTRAITMVLLVMSSLYLINGFYSWPKLLPAGLSLLLVSVLCLNTLPRTGAKLLRASIVGGLVAFAYLSHGGAVFGIIGIAVAYFLGPRESSWSYRELATAVVVFACILAPWNLYQSLIDPPGNRLIKYHLAGKPEGSKDSTLQTIVDSYRAIGTAKAVDYKFRNFRAMLGRPGDYMNSAKNLVTGNDKQRTRAAMELRNQNFVHLFASIGPMIIALPLFLLLPGLRARTPPGVKTLFTSVVFGCLAWGLLMFGPGSTMIWQGALYIPLALLIGCAIVSGLLPRPINLALVGSTLILNALIYLVYVSAPIFGPGLNPYLILSSIVALLLLIAAVVVPTGKAEQY